MTPTPEVFTAAGCRKSSHSASPGQCVEVATVPGWTAVRDSHNPQAGPLVWPTPAWQAFLVSIKTGRFDH